MRNRVLGAPLALVVLLAGGGVLPQAASAQQGGAVATTSATEPPPEIPTSAFATRSLLVSPTLSPDGTSFAARMTVGGEDIIAVFETATGKPRDRYGLGKGMELEWVRWAGNRKLLASVSQAGRIDGEDVRYTRLILLDMAAKQQAFIGRREPIVDGDDVLFVDPEGEYALLGIQRTPFEYPSVMRFDLSKDGGSKTIQNAREGVWNWYVDTSGTVRLGSGWRGNRLQIYYRAGGQDELRLVERVREQDAEERARFWNVAHIEPGTDIGYVFLEDTAGRVGLRRFDFKTREVVDTVYAHAEWDVDDAFFDHTGKARAAYYTDDRSRIVWFAEPDRKQQAALEGALKQPQVRVVSRSLDESTMLVWAGSDADPGALYAYKPAEKRLDQLAEMRPTIDFRMLAPSKAVSYTARDGTKIRGYLTLPRGREAESLPLIVMPHGGPYGVRDSQSYDDWVQLLANRGYAVIQPNYRGSGGYGKSFEELGDGQIGRRMQDDLDDAMDWAVAEGIADKSRVCVVGGSYGGYAALWAVIRNPERYRCAASWAGVTDWDSILRYDSRFLSRFGMREWRNRIRGEEGFDLDAVSPYRLAHTLARPVLVAQGTADTVVPPFQYHRFVKAAAKAKVQPVTLLLKDERHSFTEPRNEQAWYDELAAFLERHNPAE